MKKIISLILALALLLGVTAAVAEPTAIDGTSSRGIKINSAGLNPSADEMIAQNTSVVPALKGDELASIVFIACVDDALHKGISE